MLEVARGVVAVAMLDPQARLVDADADAAEASVAGRVAAGVAEHVVRRRIGDHPGVDAGEVVGVEECPAPGVAGERDERVLARRLAVELARHAAAREHRGAAAAARLAGGAAGDDRLEAAGVDRIDRDVGLDRAVDRRAQLDLVVLAALRHAAAEIDNRLLLLDRRQRVRQLLERRQPAVGVEDVELRIVGDEPVGLGLLTGRRRAFDEAEAVDAGELVERGGQRFAVGGEILDHLQRRPDRGDRAQVGRRQLLLDVVVAGSHGALEFLGLHRARVEQQHDQPPVLQIDGVCRRRRGRLRLAGFCLQDRRYGLDRRFGTRLHRHFLEVERGNRLLLAVL